MNYNLKGLILLNNRLNISQMDERVIRIQKYYSIDFDVLLREGDLNGIKWKNKYNFEFPDYAMNFTAEHGHLEVVKWLHYNREDGCTHRAMDGAAVGGYLELVKWLHCFRTEGCTDYALYWAAEFGHLEVVKFLENTFKKSAAKYYDDFCSISFKKLIEK